MTDNTAMKKYDGYNPERTLLVIDITKWHGPAIGEYCEDCAYDHHMFKCRLAIGRPNYVLLDDERHYIRPQECRDLEIEPRDFDRVKRDQYMRKFEDSND